MNILLFSFMEYSMSVKDFRTSGDYTKKRGKKIPVIKFINKIYQRNTSNRNFFLKQKNWIKNYGTSKLTEDNSATFNFTKYLNEELKKLQNRYSYLSGNPFVGMLVNSTFLKMMGGRTLKNINSYILQGNSNISEIITNKIFHYIVRDFYKFYFEKRDPLINQTLNNKFLTVQELLQLFSGNQMMEIFIKKLYLFYKPEFIGKNINKELSTFISLYKNTADRISENHIYELETFYKTFLEGYKRQLSRLREFMTENLDSIRKDLIFLQEFEYKIYQKQAILWSDRDLLSFAIEKLRIDDILSKKKKIYEQKILKENEKEEINESNNLNLPEQNTQKDINPLENNQNDEASIEKSSDTSTESSKSSESSDTSSEEDSSLSLFSSLSCLSSEEYSSEKELDEDTIKLSTYAFEKLSNHLQMKEFDYEDIFSTLKAIKEIMTKFFDFITKTPEELQDLLKTCKDDFQNSFLNSISQFEIFINKRCFNKGELITKLNEVKGNFKKEISNLWKEEMKFVDVSYQKIEIESLKEDILKEIDLRYEFYEKIFQIKND